MYSNQVSQVSTVDSEQNKPANNGSSSWYVAMAKAWGNALDKQSQKMVDESLALKDSTSVGDAIKVTAEAHKLSFLSNAASTASNSAGQALETLARKQ